jgi:hypothetical protein
MKTAMQELLEWHRKSMRSYSETNKMIEAFIEKEKKQIIEAHAFGADDVDSNGGLLLRGVKNAIYYYNQTYNQNK